MQRRSFITKATVGVGAGAAAIAAPALAQTGLPELRWRLTSGFPKSLDTIYGGAEELSRRVAQLTNNRFQIRAFAAGEIVGAFQGIDAVQAGTVEMAHTASYYWVGKNTALGFDTALPFGMNNRQQNAWLYHGGGMQAMAEVFKEFNLVAFPAGNTGVQTGGWFRTEIKTVDQLKGLKMRIPGFGGRVYAALGALPQQIPGGEIYQALERGTVDGAEFVGPYDDEKLGFFKVAKFYYAPGWQEPGATLSTYVNQKSWDSLPAEYKAAIEVASAEVNVKMMAEYDAKNPPALQRLVNNGVQLRNWPTAILEAKRKVAFEIYAEEAGKNAAFKKIFDSWNRFRQDQVRWHRFNDQALDNFVAAQRG
jgi:TRAP-type mannitol/chloroaromatic compound transport system substrate-binding protein